MIKISWTTMTYNWFSVLMLYLQQMNGGLLFKVCVFMSRRSSCKNVFIANISIFWSDWTSRSTQVYFLVTFVSDIKDRFLLSRQHNQLPNVIVKWDGCRCDSVSWYSGVTLVWRCFSMQIHCCSTICVHFILYEKSFCS